jgi:hypothetical protein
MVGGHPQGLLDIADVLGEHHRERRTRRLPPRPVGAVRGKYVGIDAEPLAWQDVSETIKQCRR